MYRSERDFSWLTVWLSACYGVSIWRDVVFSNLGSENSDAGHIKVPRPWFKLLIIQKWFEAFRFCRVNALLSFFSVFSPSTAEKLASNAHALSLPYASALGRRPPAMRLLDSTPNCLFAGRACRDRRIVRANPPIQPGRDGNRALAISGRRKRRHAQLVWQGEVRHRLAGRSPAWPASGNQGEHNKQQVVGASVACDVAQEPVPLGFGSKSYTPGAEE